MGPMSFHYRSFFVSYFSISTWSEFLINSLSRPLCAVLVQVFVFLTYWIDNP